MNTHQDEYTPNPRLQRLAVDLEILNRTLIAKGLPDSVRLARMRMFAQSTLMHTPAPKVINTPHTQRGKYPRGVRPHRGKFQAFIRHDGTLHYLGTFITPEEAHEAYKARYIELHGQPFDYEEEEAGFIDLDEELPTGVVLTADCKAYRAQITINGQTKYIGTFKTKEQAYDAFKNA
ncbi:hypothetical protein RZS08_67145, partial [Arthrospira platensis SPKY1]|nr:hypothetical protein [Arthrospira platensis SPKY1]